MIYVAALFITGLVVLIHELGHFAAARWANIPVARLSIGIGPKVWGVERNGVEYVVSAIPLGGYIMPAIEDENEFLAIPAGQRIIFALGGPVANFALGLVLFSIISSHDQGASFASLLIDPLVATFNLTLAIVAAVGALFTSPENLSSVVGIAKTGGAFVETGFLGSLRFAALISVNFAVFNLLPVPPLDGGKIVMDVLTRIKPQMAKAYLPLTAAGWVALLGLMVWATYLDIGRLA